MIIQKKIQHLTELLESYNYQYYVLDDPSVSDAEYDQIFQQLLSLEKDNPEFSDGNTSTQKMGGLALSKFEQVTHRLPMLSLDNMFTERALADSIQRATDLANSDECVFCIEPKLDGSAASIIYGNGVIVQAATRGD
jgi:DNA ligase (NAD+)